MVEAEDWWWAAIHDLAGTEPCTEPGTAKSQAAPEGSQDMQDRGPQQARLSRIGPGIDEVAIDVVHCLVCVQRASGMRFASQAQGKALLHFGCTGAMLCVSSLLQDWAGYSDSRWSALTGSVGSKQQSSLAKTAADKAEADKTAAAEETVAGQAAADKTAAEPTLERKVKRPKSAAQAAPAPAARSPAGPAPPAAALPDERCRAKSKHQGIDKNQTRGGK